MATLAEIHKARISGEGPETVLLGHGFGTDQSVWHNLEPLLVKRHYRLIMYNLMGAGTGVPTGFSSTSLGYSANSNESEPPSGSPNRTHPSNALQRATSDYNNEELAEELEKLGVFDDKRSMSFGRKIGDSFGRLLGRKKKKSSKARVQNGGVGSSSNLAPRAAEISGGVEKPSKAAPRDPEYAGRREGFRVEDLGEATIQEETIPEEEAEGLITEGDINLSRYTTLEAFADDLLNLVDELGLTKLYYIGHSMSGIIGILASVKRPQLFKKLVLLASSPRYVNEGDYVGGFKDEDIQDLLTAVKSNYKQWVHGFAPAAIHSPDQDAVADFSAGLLDVRPDVAYCILNAIFTSDFRDVLPKVTVPCHLLASNNDVAVPLSVQEYLHKHLKNSVLEVLPTQGHLPHLSSPMIVNASFIKHLEQPP